MKSIVSYVERGEGDNNNYRGNCSPKLIKDLIEHFKVSEISDYMSGSNTTSSVANQLNIKANTYDLNMGYDLLNNEIKERNEFIFWRPPYWDIIKYSGNMYGKPMEQDLSRIKEYDKFMSLINECMLKQFYSLEKGGKMSVLMGDIKKKGKLYSMILDIVKPGDIENIVIKEQHNCWSDRKSYFGKFIPIVHEYLLILKKPSDFIINIAHNKSFKVDLRDSDRITWKDLVALALENLGNKAKLDDIYRLLEGHKKAEKNKHWKEKIRQTLQQYEIFKSSERGVWEI